MNADLSVDKIEINPSEVATTMSAAQDRIQIAPVKKPKPQTKPKPPVTADWTVDDVTESETETETSHAQWHNVVNLKPWTTGDATS